MPEGEPFDLETYPRSVRKRPCFICGLVRRDPGFEHHVVYEDDHTIASSTVIHPGSDTFWFARRSKSSKGLHSLR